MYLIKPEKNLFFVFMCFDTKFVTPKPLFDTSFKKFVTHIDPLSYNRSADSL